MERSIKIPGGCRLNHPLTRTYIIVPYSGSLQRLIVSKAKSLFIRNSRYMADFSGKEAAMLPFPPGCRELHPRTSDTRERRWKPAGWPLSQEPGASSCKFYKHGGRTDAGELRPSLGATPDGHHLERVIFSHSIVNMRIFSAIRRRTRWDGFPYPFVMFLAIMILVGLWQHMFLGDWPFQDMKQPLRGIVETIVNVVLTWFVIDMFVFTGSWASGFNFLSYYGLEAAGSKGASGPGAIVRVLS